MGLSLEMPLCNDSRCDQHLQIILIKTQIFRWYKLFSFSREPAEPGICELRVSVSVKSASLAQLPRSGNFFSFFLKGPTGTELFSTWT